MDGAFEHVTHAGRHHCTHDPCAASRGGAYRLHCWQKRWRRPARRTTDALRCASHTLCLRLYRFSTPMSALHRSTWQLGPTPPLPPAAAATAPAPLLLAAAATGEEPEAPAAAATLLAAAREELLEAPPAAAGLLSSTPCGGGSAPLLAAPESSEPSPDAAAAASAAMDAAAELEGAMPVPAKEESGIRGRELARVDRSSVEAWSCATFLGSQHEWKIGEVVG